MKMTNEFDKWLTFSRREKIGIFILALILFTVTLLIRIIPTTEKEYNEENLSQYAEQMDKLFKKEVYKKDKPNQNMYSQKKRVKKNKPANVRTPLATIERDSISILNPNTASIDELVKIGIPEKVANTLNNFRKKGGKFFSSEDLLKIYGMPVELYEEIKPQLEIPEYNFKKKVKVNVPWPKTIKKEKVIVDINTGDKSLLMGLPGIGPYYADKIIEYREELGGYYQISQLLEIKRFPDSTLQAITPLLTLSGEIEKKDINTCDLRMLMSHPYISKAQAKAILSHRDFNLKLRSWKELQNILKITPKEVDKMAAYFTIQ